MILIPKTVSATQATDLPPPVTGGWHTQGVLDLGQDNTVFQ